MAVYSLLSPDVDRVSFALHNDSNGLHFLIYRQFEQSVQPKRSIMSRNRLGRDQKAPVKVTFANTYHTEILIAPDIE